MLTIDTELSIKLPENLKAFLATKFENQEIQKLSYQQRLSDQQRRSD